MTPAYPCAITRFGLAVLASGRTLTCPFDSRRPGPGPQRPTRLGGRCTHKAATPGLGRLFLAKGRTAEVGAAATDTLATGRQLRNQHLNLNNPQYGDDGQHFLAWQRKNNANKTPLQLRREIKQCTVVARYKYHFQLFVSYSS